MFLRSLNDTDKTKLHSEVNQILNQRFLVTTLAVTVWGFAVAGLIPRDAPSSPEPIGMFRYVASIQLTLVLFVLFMLTHYLSQILRIVTTYLDETGASDWEKDCKMYRTKFKFYGYTKPQTLVFLVLGAFSTALPFLLSWTISLLMDPSAGQSDVW